MGRNWIIDVIADLQKFAERNDLPLLSAELSRAKTVAVAEVSAIKEDAGATAWGDDADTQHIFSQLRNR